MCGLRFVQPVTATIIPPIAWFAFAWATGASGSLRAMAWHALGPVLAVIFLLTDPMLLDLLIPLSFAGYGAAILLALSRGEESLPHSRLQSGALPLLGWRIIAISLIASATCDVLIAYSMARGATGALYWLPSLVSSLSLLSLGALGLTKAMESPRDEDANETAPPQADLDRDRAILVKLEDYLKTHRPFVDPDLTLDRLSRKTLIPAKQLSAAVNRATGENVSRYINRQRIEEACRLLVEGQSVTGAMLDSGFNTKSNFNREFLRVKGASPSKWLQEQKRVLKVAGQTPNSVMDRVTEEQRP